MGQQNLIGSNVRMILNQWSDNSSTQHGRRQTIVLSIIPELWRFLRARKKFWMLPMFVVFAIFGALIILTQGSAAAPFIYTLF